MDESSSDQLIVEKIAHFLEPFKNNQEKLRQLLAPSALAKVAATLTKEVCSAFPDENLPLIQKSILLELKHRLNDLVDDPRAIEKKTQELLHFVEDDVLNSVENAVEQAIDRGLRDSSALKELAHDTSLEVHQILLKVKKEIDSPQALVKPAVRQALAILSARLDMEYSVVNTFRILRTKLGISFMAGVLKKLSLIIDEAVKQFKAHPEDPAHAIAALTAKTHALHNKAQVRAQAEFSNPRLQKLILTDMEHAFSEMTNEERLKSLLTTVQ